MNLIRNAVKSHVSVRTLKPIHALPSFLREPSRRFSTEPDQQQSPPPNASTEPDQQQSPPPNASIDKFLDSANKGSVYAKLFGTTKYTMKSDIISLLEGCNLTPDDVKVCYSRSFFPVAVMLRFPSPAAFSNATRTIRRFDRLYRLDRAEASDWDIVMPYDGKTVVLQGLPRSATFEDVERFLSGCEYDSTSIQMLSSTRPGSNYAFRLTTVQFPSHIQAMNACISKNRKVCLNNTISVRVLY